MRAITKLIGSLWFLLPSIAFANEGIAQFKNFLTQAQSAEGDFVQQQIRPARAGEEKPKVLRKSQGHFIFQRPGKFVWETIKPFEQKVIADGQNLLLWDKDLNQLTIRPAGQSLQSTPAAILFGGSAVEAHFDLIPGEEKGGIGATWLAKNNADLLRQFDRAIAFDRRGIDSVITHQGFGRCCSDNFGTALCAAIGAIDDNLMHLNDDTGVYTDTAEFVDLIPECTNISIGYSNEHTQNESLNIVYFNMLAKALVHVDFDSLPVVRDPLAPDPDDWRMYRRTGYWSTDWNDYAVYSTRSEEHTSELQSH